MCLCGEIIVPHENTALSGDLQVDVLGITTSSCVQLLERSLYPPEDETEYLVLGSAVVQRSRAGDPSTQRGVHLRSHRHLCFMSRQAISGAVIDVRMDIVPSLAVHARPVNSMAHTEVSIVPAISPLERLALVHIAVILLLIIVLLTSTCLGAQYMARYRKYQLTAAN
ncbi:hypothetical protein J6590_031298 [Homalodisca vitripennis]|nr:hypothetical protein J6590_031298 [Homalodisca vitripennis]